MKKEDLIEEVTEQAPQEDIAEYLPTPAEDFSHTLEAEKSADVFNALSMFNEDLGVLYETQGYNPFEKDFVLTEDYTFDILEHKGNPNQISKEEFLEKGNEEISKHFQKALHANKALLAKTEKELATVTDPNVKEQLQKMIVTLKNRNELLKLNIDKLKQKDANALKMYMEMFGMDAELSDLLKEEFTEKVNKNIVIQRMIELCNTRSNKKQQRKLNKQQKNVLNPQNQKDQQNQQSKENANNKNPQWFQNQNPEVVKDGKANPFWDLNGDGKVDGRDFGMRGNPGRGGRGRDGMGRDGISREDCDICNQKAAAAALAKQFQENYNISKSEIDNFNNINPQGNKNNGQIKESPNSNDNTKTAKNGTAVETVSIHEL